MEPVSEACGDTMEKSHMVNSHFDVNGAAEGSMYLNIGVQSTNNSQKWLKRFQRANVRCEDIKYNFSPFGQGKRGRIKTVASEERKGVRNEERFSQYFDSFS